MSEVDYDLVRAVEPKSDQLNFDDVSGIEMTGTVTGVDVRDEQGQKRIWVHLDSFPRPWKPSKGMARILISAWGKMRSEWVGHTVTLFGDPSIKFGKDEVGGIRIRAITGLDKPTQFKVTERKGSRKVFVVQPLGAVATSSSKPRATDTGSKTPKGSRDPHPAVDPQEDLDHYAATLVSSQTIDQLGAAWGKIPPGIKPRLAAIKDKRKEAIANPVAEEAPPADIGSF